jgi:ribonuclease T2
MVRFGLGRGLRIFARFGYLFFAAVIGLGAATGASAQDRRQNTPGEFDYYVLSLSWSPSFCEEVADRSSGGRSQQAQCGGRPFSFVVHGLWPQYEHGYPESCDRDSWLGRNIMTSMLDLMPAPGLIFNEWKKHGTCSGLSPRAYFDTIRKARAGVKIPPEFIDLADTKTVSPAEVEDAFIKVNPGLSASGVAVTCNRRSRLSEVRICMTKDLQFRACDEADRRSCRRDQVTMPPVRGG